MKIQIENNQEKMWEKEFKTSEMIR